jgi:hypothetical protein
MISICRVSCNTRGTVMINSTVGLSALFHKSPLKILGDAIYALKGLVYQGDLDQFWGEAQKVKIDYKLFGRFRSYLIDHTQLNGSFYRRLPIPGTFAGIRWEERRRKPRKGKSDRAADAAVRVQPDGGRGRTARTASVPKVDVVGSHWGTRNRDTKTG